MIRRILVTLSANQYTRAAIEHALELARHHDAEVIVDQAKRIATGAPLTASDGSELVLEADTLCVHGDNPESVAAVKAIRQALMDIEVAS